MEQREYIQLHRDTTVQSLTVSISLEGGIITHGDAPLVRACRSAEALLDTLMGYCSSSLLCMLHLCQCHRPVDVEMDRFCLDSSSSTTTSILIIIIKQQQQHIIIIIIIIIIITITIIIITITIINNHHHQSSPSIIAITITVIEINHSIMNNFNNHKNSHLASPSHREGRVIMIDEADKAPLEVVCILKGLLEDGSMILSDGRRLERNGGRDGEEEGGGARGVVIPIHPNFRAIVLANRPGFPFLGNDFFHECGDIFSCHVRPLPPPRSCS